MLIDGISLADGSVIANSHVESGITFPSAGVTVGRMFYLTAVNGANQIGLYVFDGSIWVTGDITEIIPGDGMVGGGAQGSVTLSIDPTVVATRTYVDDVTTTDIAEGTNLYYTAVRASADAPVQSVAGRTGVITLAVADVSGAAPINDPAFTGIPTAPTATVGTDTTQLATTAFVQAEIANDAMAVGVTIDGGAF